ncbi:MAG: hypothetical protein K9K75_00675 [Deltaproteobacteria bacterium]|nr:hypothetical protein [Deltaproteobacteria bacterium]
MPALDDAIDEILATYFYYVAGIAEWEVIRQQGLVADDGGMIAAISGYDADLFAEVAKSKGLSEYIVLRFNPTTWGVSPTPHEGPKRCQLRCPIIGPCLIERVPFSP